MPSNEKFFSPQEKIRILKRYLLGDEDINQICQEYKIDSQTLQSWQDKLFQFGEIIFEANFSEIASNEQYFSKEGLTFDNIFQFIIDNLPDPIMMHDIKGKYLVFNKAVAYYLGIPKSELIGKDESVAMDIQTAQ